MFSLVDMCNKELAKLREKGQAMINSSPPTATTTITSIGEQSCTASTTSVGYPAGHLSQALRLKHRPPPTLCSEAALSMMVDCFSP